MGGAALAGLNHLMNRPSPSGLGQTGIPSVDLGPSPSGAYPFWESIQAQVSQPDLMEKYLIEIADPTALEYDLHWSIPLQPDWEMRVGTFVLLRQESDGSFRILEAGDLLKVLAHAWWGIALGGISTHLAEPFSLSIRQIYPAPSAEIGRQSLSIQDFYQRWETYTGPAQGQGRPIFYELIDRGRQAAPGDYTVEVLRFGFTSQSEEGARWSQPHIEFTYRTLLNSLGIKSLLWLPPAHRLRMPFAATQDRLLERQALLPEQDGWLGPPPDPDPPLDWSWMGSGAQFATLLASIAYGLALPPERWQRLEASEVPDVLFISTFLPYIAIFNLGSVSLVNPRFDLSSPFQNLGSSGQSRSDDPQAERQSVGTKGFVGPYLGNAVNSPEVRIDVLEVMAGRSDPGDPLHGRFYLPLRWVDNGHPAQYFGNQYAPLPKVVPLTLASNISTVGPDQMYGPVFGFGEGVPAFDADGSPIVEEIDPTQTGPVYRVIIDTGHYSDSIGDYEDYQEAIAAGEDWLVGAQMHAWDDYRENYWGGLGEDEGPETARGIDEAEARLWEEFQEVDEAFYEVFAVELGEDGEEILHETSDPVGPYRAASPAAEAEESPAAPDPRLQPQVDESRPYAEEAADPFERVRGEYDVEDTRPVSEQEMEDLLADLESLGIDLTSDDDDENLSGSGQKRVDIGWAVLAGGVLLSLLRRE